MKTLTVGELAKLAGVTVRTLHHYETKGLLAPTGRSAAGYRLYGETQLQRLVCIRILQQNGMSLAQIAAALANPGINLEQLLQQHVNNLQALCRQHQRQLAQMRGVLAAIRDRNATVADMTQILELLTMFEQHYTPQQLAALRDKAAAMGDEGMQQAQQAWVKIFADLRKAMDEGQAVDTPAVQAIVEQAKTLIAQFTGGDAQIGQSLTGLYEQQSPVEMMRGFGMDVDDALWLYYQNAMAVSVR